MAKKLIKLAAASLVSASATYSAAAPDPSSAPDGNTIITGTHESGCRILSGQCNGEQQSLSLRFGNPAARRELVLSLGEFTEATRGGVDRSFAITHRSKKLASLDFWLNGGLGVSGKTLAVDKFFPVGNHGVLQLGGYVGRITGRAEAEAGAALSVVRPAVRYAASNGQSVEQGSYLVGLRQAAGAYMPLTPHIAITTQQHLAVGLDKGQAGVAIGLAYFSVASDRLAMRPDGCGTQMHTAKGTVLSLQVCANELLYNKLGSKLDSKFTSAAGRINSQTVRAESYGQHIPAVRGGQIAQIMGYTALPRHEQAVSLTIALPLSQKTLFTAAVRRSPVQTSTSATLAYQF